MGIHSFTRSTSGAVRPLSIADDAASERRRLLRAPLLLRTRADVATRARIVWNGPETAHIRILGSAAAHVADEAGTPVTQLLPGRDYDLVVGAVRETGELRVQVGDASQGDRLPMVHRIILAGTRPRRAEARMAPVIDLALWVASGNLSRAEDRR